MTRGIRGITPKNPNYLPDGGENPPLEETSDSLPGHTERAASPQSDAGIRAQPVDHKQVATLALTGRRHG
ncbi:MULTISPECIES: hypothetical protein [unclassified Moorena]|uniref:hypothetical protein n=1 Tax=unclassified Moorena TaxID=2683338 RepID=UPI0013FF6847|nr:MULTISPECIES: hypothetical protein [unclassified Moorena]NEO17260.1 hypothetical protein [Moorena sp. SIO3E8]NEQ03795.1 hypothetical protein [Moorena sp. SIO3F7]